MTADRRDPDIRAALTPSSDVVVPMDLAGAIHAQLVVTPQERPGWGDRLWGVIPQTPLVRSALRLAVVAAALLAVAVAVAIASRQDDKPGIVEGYHGDDARTGLMPGPGPSGIPVVDWSVDLAGPFGALSMPLVRDGIVIVSDTRGTATALDLVTGMEVWRLEDLGRGSGAPVLSGANLVLATDDGTVTAIDLATRDEVWTTRSGAPTTAPLTRTAEAIIVGGEDGMVRGLSPIDGRLLWSFEVGGPVQRAPAIVDGIVYAAGLGGHVTAYEPATDRVLWSWNLGEGEVSTPVVSQGALYLTHGPIDLATPHELVAVDTATGQVTGTWPSPTLDRLFVGAVVDGLVYTVGEDGAVRVVDPTVADGEPSLLAQFASPIDSLATVVGQTLYVSDRGGEVHAVDLETAAERWSVTVAGAPTMPVVVDGRVIVATDVGRAFVLADPFVP